MRPNSPKKVAHRKSRAGCLTCRIRRVKCDETRPACLRCQKADRVCEGYQAQSWIYYTEKKHHTDEPKSLVYYRDKPPKEDAWRNNGDEDVIPINIIKYFGPKLNGWQSALFEGVPPQVPDDYVSKIIKHAHDCTWTQLLAFYPDETIKMIKQHWTDTMTASPMSFYANMYSFGMHYRNRIGCSKEEDLLHVAYQNQTIRYAVEEIDRISKGLSKPSRQILVTVLILASFNTNSHKIMAKNFQQGQECVENVYMDRHEKMLYWLIDSIGGLHVIPSPGTRHVIYIHDLVKASIYSRKPIISRQSRSKFLEEEEAMLEIEAEIHEVNIQDMNYVLRCMQKLVSAIERREVSERKQEVFSDLIIARTDIQHQLLSLPYGPFRTALLIFSDIHIFPLPSNSYVKERLAVSLRRQLYELDFEADATTLLWMNFMGAQITQNEEHDWFVDRAAEAASRSNLTGFVAVKEALKSILWSEMFLAPRNFTLWNKICMMTAGLTFDYMEDDFVDELLISDTPICETSRSWSLILAWGREYVMGPE